MKVKVNTSYFLYDEDSTNIRLWRGLTKEDKPKEIKGLEFEGGKISQSQTNIDPRIFIIDNENLYYKKPKSRSVPKAAFDLKWTLVEFYEVESSNVSNSNQYKYVMRLNKNGKFVQILLEDDIEVEKWRTPLSRSGVFFNDFQDRYTILDCLDESTFGHVKNIFN